MTSTDRTYRIGLVHSCWHSDIVDRAPRRRVEEVTAPTGASVEVFTVPGAFELPLHAAPARRHGPIRPRSSRRAFVVDGGIYRHEFVADAP